MVWKEWSYRRQSVSSKWGICLLPVEVDQDRRINHQLVLLELMQTGDFESNTITVSFSSKSGFFKNNYGIGLARALDLQRENK